MPKHGVNRSTQSIFIIPVLGGQILYCQWGILSEWDDCCMGFGLFITHRANRRALSEMLFKTTNPRKKAGVCQQSECVMQRHSPLSIQINGIG